MVHDADVCFGSSVRFSGRIGWLVSDGSNGRHSIPKRYPGLLTVSTTNAGSQQTSISSPVLSQQSHVVEYRARQRYHIKTHNRDIQITAVHGTTEGVTSFSGTFRWYERVPRFPHRARFGVAPSFSSSLGALRSLCMIECCIDLACGGLLSNPASPEHFFFRLPSLTL